MRNSKRKSSPGGDCPAEIPEEVIMSDILLKITDGECLGRCRCVCRSWRDYLSAPSLIRHKLLLPTPDSRSDCEIMIPGSVNDDYRLYSPDTLELLTPNYSSSIRDLVPDWHL
ncbi:unnamed protein product [Linum trigynum]